MTRRSHGEFAGAGPQNGICVAPPTDGYFDLDIAPETWS
jgi:hypothetical protein